LPVSIVAFPSSPLQHSVHAVVDGRREGSIALKVVARRKWPLMTVVLRLVCAWNGMIMRIRPFLAPGDRRDGIY